MPNTTTSTQSTEQATLTQPVQPQPDAQPMPQVRTISSIEKNMTPWLRTATFGRTRNGQFAGRASR